MASSIRATLRRHPALQLGAKGQPVRKLEQLLRKNKLNVPKIDGVFDRALVATVKRFQLARGLKVDGKVGQQTWAALLGLKAPPPGVNLLKKPALRAKSAIAYHRGRPRRIKVVPVGGGQYLAAHVAPRYLAMIRAARRAGVRLTHTSGFRTHYQQQVLYRRYGSGRAAPPGHSNHQQGLSMDIGNIGGYGTRAYRWLSQNARKFGFVNDVRGEFWHWTYRR